MIESRKTFILDTSVLLYDKNSIHSFPGANIVIPLVVLDELDRFKDRNGILGENARYVNRFLDELRSAGSLHEGVTLENLQSIRVEINNISKVPQGLDASAGDNRIIALANNLSQMADSDVTVVTKDINFRVKCDALRIKAEDYYRDKIVSDEKHIYSGEIEVSTDQHIIDSFFKNGKVDVELLDSEEKLYQNQFIIAKGNTGSMLGIVRENNVQPLVANLWESIDVSPRNKEQKFALDLLTREDIPLVTMTGIAGSGKTFLTLMCGLSGIKTGKYDRIVFTRTLQPVGRDIGYLPGNIKEKMDPWLSPIFDNFRHAFKDTTYFELMRDKGEIEVAPMSFIRGRTFNNTFLIVDEAQNSSIHELKTVITRIGENSKIVLLGDIEQVDTPYLDSLSNGLTVIIHKFKDEKLAGHITLKKGERSKLATLASSII